MAKSRFIILGLLGEDDAAQNGEEETIVLVNKRTREL